MCFVAQHDPSGQAWFPSKNNDDKKSFGGPSPDRSPKTPSFQVLAGENRSQRGSLFSLSPVSHPRKKSSPSLSFPPCFPLFQLRRVPGWAHRRGFPALLADVKLKRKESVNRSLTNISPSLLESTVRVWVYVRVGVYCCEGRTDGLWGQWLRGWQTGEVQHRHCEGKTPHGCVDKATGGEVV